MIDVVPTMPTRDWILFNEEEPDGQHVLTHKKINGLKEKGTFKSERSFKFYEQGKTGY